MTEYGTPEPGQPREDLPEQPRVDVQDEGDDISDRRRSRIPGKKKPARIPKTKVTVNVEMSIEQPDDETEEDPNPESPRL
jgi:hypothetical protein